MSAKERMSAQEPTGAQEPMSAEPPQRAAEVEAHLGDGVHVLRRPDDGSEHLVNETALALWQLCDGATTPEEMIEGVVELFGEDRERIAADVATALHQLREAGLLHVGEAAVQRRDAPDPDAQDDEADR